MESKRRESNKDFQAVGYWSFQLQSGGKGGSEAGGRGAGEGLRRLLNVRRETLKGAGHRCRVQGRSSMLEA